MRLRLQRSHWGLRHRLALALLGAGLVIVIVVGASGVVLYEVRRAQQRVIEDYYAAGRLSNQYLVSLVDADADVQSYVLTGRESMIADLPDTDPPWDSVQPIRDRLSDSPAALQALDRTQQSALTWYRDWAQPAMARVRQGERIQPADVDEGRARFHDVRDAYTAYITVERAARARALARLNDLTNLLFYAVLLSALVAIATAAMLWGLLNRWVSIPVARLGAETRVVSGGRLDHAVSVPGPRDFVELSADVEAMRRRLVLQIEAVEKASREISAARSQLEEQAAALQRSNQELEQFAYVASHDLQEPLRKISSFCQMLQRRYAGQLDEKADQYIGFAVDGAVRMQQLINALLEFSRVGRSPVPNIDVDLQRSARTAVTNLEVAIHESGAQVSWQDLPLGPVLVHGEPTLLVQLFQNLIGNAVKFRSAQPPDIRLGARRQGHEWQLWCSDNGIGIDPRFGERVFMIFQRLHPRDQYEGTGIGLALCRKIVEYHGGRIWVDDTVTSGTTVRWTLPAVTSTARGVTTGTSSEGSAADDHSIRDSGRLARRG